MKIMLKFCVGVIGLFVLFAINFPVLAKSKCHKENIPGTCVAKWGDWVCETREVCDESNYEETEGSTSVGINLSSGCTMGMGKNCFDYEQIIGIDKDQNPNITAKSIAQDVILAATYMVGIVLTIVIIYCGLMYIFASGDGKGKDVSSYKKGLISAAIGACLVWGAYAIVRLIQYIAKG